MKRSILVIESDPKYRKLETSALSSAGFEVLTAESCAQGFALLSSACPDAVILGISSRENEEMRLLGQIREWSSLPIIVTASGNSEKIRISALDSGADIVLEKPLSTAELTAYIKVCMRRKEEFETLSGRKAGTRFKAEGLTVDTDARTVCVNGKDIKLTKNEFRILALLCRYSGKVLTYDFIMRHIWGPGTGGNGILRVNMTNIRRKIEPDAENPVFIFTENGIGYRLIPGEFEQN